MALTLEETESDLTYRSPEVTLIIKKDDEVLDVHQITPVGYAKGQTWTSIRDYLPDKLGVSP